MNCALTIYPLSAAFKRGLESTLGGPVTYISMQELRVLSPPAALRRLRALRPTRLVLPIEDESSRATIGLLAGVAAVTQARNVEIVTPDLTTERVNALAVVGGVARIGAASVASRVAAARLSRVLSRLAVEERVRSTMGRDRKTLYLNANLWFGVKAGGSIGHIAGVANELSRRGHEVVYASVGGRGMVREDIPLVKLSPPAVFGLPYELNYYRFGAMASRQLLRSAAGPFGLIYQRMSVGNFAGVQLSRAWGVPLIVEYNGSEVWIARNWGRPMRYEELALAAEQACLRHAHLIVTISDVLRDELMERGVEASRIVSYPNCIDPDLFTPDQWTRPAHQVRARLGVQPDEMVVMFLGTFGQWHGAEVLAQGIRRMVDEDAAGLRDRRVRFVLVGDGLKMPEVRSILDTQACAEFVVLTGLIPQHEAPAYLRMADIVVSPHVPNADGSRFFGSPTKLFEYMAMGSAIVASDLDQIGAVLRRSIRSGDLPTQAPGAHETSLALLCPPGDVAALARGLRYLMERSDWRAVLGANARREALARYTWKHHVDAIMTRVTGALDGNAG